MDPNVREPGAFDAQIRTMFRDAQDETADGTGPVPTPSVFPPTSRHHNPLQAFVAQPRPGSAEKVRWATDSNNDNPPRDYVKSPAFDVEMEEIPRSMHRTASTASSGSQSNRTLKAIQFSVASSSGSLGGSAVVDDEKASPLGGALARHRQQGGMFQPASDPDENSVVRWIKESAASLLMSARYTKSDVVSRPRNCCIGLIAVFLVTFFTALVLTAISKTPIVLLRFAELQVGEMDGLMLAQGGLPFINYTEMEPKIRENATLIAASTPRWLIKGQIQSSQTRQKYLNQKVNVSVPTLPTNVLIVDSTRENDAGFGRGWPYRRIGYSEVQVFQSALEYINVPANSGDRMMLFIDLEQILSQQGINLAEVAGLTELQDALDLLNFGDIEIETNFGNLTNFFNEIIIAVNDSLRNQTIPPIPRLPTFAPNATFQNNTLPPIPTLPTLAPGLTFPPLPTIPPNFNFPNFTFPNGTLDIPDPLSFAVPQMQLTVADAIESPMGKYPSLLGNMAVLDYRYFLDMVLDQSCLDGSQTFSGGPDSLVTAPLSFLQLLGVNSSELRNFQVTDYALLVVVLFQNRFNIYYMDLEDRTKQLILISNNWFRAIGLDYKGTVQFPIALALQVFDGINTFLFGIFIMLVILIVILGVILVYSLLITNADERKFEVAMLRAMGIAKPRLVSLMTMEALVFIIPGICLGVSLLYFVNYLVELALSEVTFAPAQPTNVPVSAVVVGAVFGLLVPIAANWQPIMDAMQTSLRDALDIFRQRNTETRVFMVKLEEMGLQPWQTMLGCFLVVSGFMVYYLIPYSFVFGNFKLFFIVLDLILLTMLLGLCMLSYATQGILMKGTLWLTMMWGKEKRLHTLILKNMEAHKDRNAATFMMFVITASSVIFGGIIFHLLAETLIQAVMLANGADLQCQSLQRDTPLDSVMLNTYLNESVGTYVAAWAFATYTLSSSNQITTRTAVRNTIGSGASLPVVGVTETFLDAVFPDFVLWDGLDPKFTYGTSSTGVTDVVRSMFAQNSTSADATRGAADAYTGFPPNVVAPDVIAKSSMVIPAIIPSSAPNRLGIDAGAFASLEYAYATNRTGVQETTFAFSVRGLAKRLSGFPGITSLFPFFSAGAMIIPAPMWGKLLEANKIDFPGNLSVTGTDRLRANAQTNVSYQNAFIRLKPGLSKRERTFFVNSLQSRLNPYFHITLDTKSITDDVRTASDLINGFFFFSSAVAITLCTFMMWISFVSNVQSNAWSYGVLRSLGFTQAQLIRATIYEAVTIVIASSIVGTIIGLIVGITLQIQMQNFLNFPPKFRFPVELFFFTVGMGLISAVIGSLIPMLRLCRKPISTVLKSM